MSTPAIKISPSTLATQRSIQLTLQHLLPQLGAIAIVFLPVRLPATNALRWECYMYSQYGGSLFRTTKLYMTAEEALMGVYVRYRELVADYRRHARDNCEWCGGGWDEESEDEDEGYSET